MTQRYSDPVAQERMSMGLCPECGEPPESHLNDLLFFAPCSLREDGVRERVAEFDEYRPPTADHPLVDGTNS